MKHLMIADIVECNKLKLKTSVGIKTFNGAGIIVGINLIKKEIFYTIKIGGNKVSVRSTNSKIKKFNR